MCVTKRFHRNHCVMKIFLAEIHPLALNKWKKELQILIASVFSAGRGLRKNLPKLLSFFLIKKYLLI